MRIAETCTCGASIEVEMQADDQDDTANIGEIVGDWRNSHQCVGPQPWRRSERSTVASDLAFGFDAMHPREDEVRA